SSFRHGDRAHRRRPPFPTRRSSDLTASFAMGMLDEGAGQYDALSFADAADRLGMQWGTGAGLDDASVYVSALKMNLEPSIELMRSEEHTSELQSRENLVCRLLLEKK